MPLLRLVVASCFLLTAVTACGSPTTSSASPSAALSSPSAGPPSKLDPAVAIPADFPADVPIYPGARLTAAAKFSANGQTTWGLEWETLDGIDKVHTFYAAKLSQGDWTTQFGGAASTTFAATFTRKSNGKVSGILSADSSSSVTKISLSLLGG